jgi:hypothetical protein
MFQPSEDTPRPCDSIPSSPTLSTTSYDTGAPSAGPSTEMSVFRLDHVFWQLPARRIPGIFPVKILYVFKMIQVVLKGREYTLSVSQKWLIIYFILTLNHTPFTAKL